MAKIVMIIAPEGYQDIEYEDSKKALLEKGDIILTASTTHEAKGSLGGSTKTDLLLDEISADNFDAIAFIGGPGCHIFFNDPKAISLIKDFYNKNKIVAAICSAPSTLANAGILKDKKATSYPDEAENLKKNGAIYTGNPVEQDKKIITANGPRASRAFGEAIHNALK